MYIRELYMKNFGRFSEKTYLIEDGIQVFYGDNESGKSTVYAFIKGMLFGIERGRGRAAKNDSFRQYEPWKNSNYYTGILRFSAGERNFRLERTFDKVSKSASLICEDDGEELSLEQGDLTMLLDGMTEETFDDTVAIGQLAVETSKDLAITLQNFAANFYATGNSELNLSRALDGLKQRQKELEIEQREEQASREIRREKVLQEQEFVERDLENLKKELHEVEKEKRHLKMQQELARENDDGEEEVPRFSLPGWFDKRAAAIAGGVLLLIVILFVLLRSPWNFIMLAVVLAGGIAAGIVLYQKSWLGAAWKKDSAVGHLSRTVARQEERFKWQKSHLLEEIHEKQTMHENLQEQLQELNESDDSFQSREKKKEALELASSEIQKLAAQLQKDFGRILNEKASSILNTITEGRYTQLFITENHEMFLITKYRRIPIERVSRGTIDQVYFSLRMAAADFLFEGDYPVILDETFAFYDKNRLKAVLKWLSECKKQVIIFTCQEREMEMLEQLGIPYHVSQVGEPEN
ncbi:MAG: AAA family ATPase [Hespellia sp.]|nr:AAA family ATPase [Hespellia sp.]